MESEKLVRQYRIIQVCKLRCQLFVRLYKYIDIENRLPIKQISRLIFLKDDFIINDFCA